MKAKILFLLVLPIFSMGQDYVVDEIFEPDNYSGGFAEVSPNNRIIYSWGLNIDHTELNLIKETGSNYFDFRYQYNIPVLKTVYFTLGFGSNWNVFNMNNDSNLLYIDSLFHEKRKLRFQNITSVVGLRFQAKKHPNESWCLEVNFLTSLSMARYCSVLSSAAPEITNGVLASSIKQESISSTIV